MEREEFSYGQFEQAPGEREAWGIVRSNGETVCVCGTEADARMITRALNMSAVLAQPGYSIAVSGDA